MNAPKEGKKTVVIFEDALATQELLKIFFSKLGYATKIYGDGGDAVGRVRRDAPALVMMDLMMPGQSGFEACADIRKEDTKTPIVVLSVLTDDDHRERALSAGADVYLVKPFKPSDLEAVISPLLARPR